MEMKGKGKDTEMFEKKKEKYIIMHNYMSLFVLTFQSIIFIQMSPSLYHLFKIRSTGLVEATKAQVNHTGWTWTIHLYW